MRPSAIAEVETCDPPSVQFTKTTVGTDTKLSWDFYERSGFTKVRRFNMTAYHYSLPDDTVTGSIYSLDI